MALCACGCGQETKTATKTNNKRGIKKDQPLKYVHGHNIKAFHPLKEKGGHSEESKAKLSLSHKGKSLSEEHKENIGRGNRMWALCKGSRLVRHCAKCGQSFEKQKSYLKNKAGKYCSADCYRESIKGERPSRNLHSHKEWKARVRARDAWTCRICGYKGANLHVHHTRRFSRYPEWAEEDWNGITLCEDCHKAITHRSPKKVELAAKVASQEGGRITIECSLKEALEIFEMYDGG